jgi:hypothetical protein
VNTPGTIKHSSLLKQQVTLSYSYDKEGEFLSKPKNSIQFPKKFSNTLDEENRLCRTMGEDSHYDSINGSSVERNSLERHSVVHHPSFDPYISSRSYNYDHSSSFTKDHTSYLQNNLLKGSNQSSKNSYNGVKQTLNYEVSPSGTLNSKLMTYSVSNSARAESSIDKVKESIERESLYAGVISAGSGSVSSTKIKKELEHKKKKKLKKIEYLNKTKVGVSVLGTNSSIKMAGHIPSVSGNEYLINIIGGSKKNVYPHYQIKYKFKPTSLLGSSRETKPPLSTINGQIPSSDVTSYKFNRSRVEGLPSNRESSVGSSFRSIDRNSDRQSHQSSSKPYIKDSKRTVAAKLSATLPKSTNYKKFSGISYKQSMYHKKHVGGQKIQVYSNSQREYSKSNYSNILNHSQNSGVKNLSTPNTGISYLADKSYKYVRMPKSILKPSSSHDSNVDGNAVHVRTLETSMSPFRMDNGR